LEDNATNTAESCHTLGREERLCGEKTGKCDKVNTIRIGYLVTDTHALTKVLLGWKTMRLTPQSPVTHLAGRRDSAEKKKFTSKSKAIEDNKQESW
jgi:hypothetical protein